MRLYTIAFSVALIGSCLTPSVYSADTDGDGVPDERDLCPDIARGSTVDQNGCYTWLLETARSGNPAAVDLLVNFDTNSHQVRRAQHNRVAALADFLNANPSVIVVIEGHTDSVGDAHYNQWLSRQRADAVARLLTDRFGVSRTRIRTIGYGEGRAVETNRTPAGRSANRRVVAVVDEQVAIVDDQ